MAARIVTVFLARSAVLASSLVLAPVSALAAAGDLDPAFGSSGTVMTSFGPGRHDQGYAVAVQADGKIVVAGESYNGASYDVALARYTELGALDPDFGAGGLVLTPFPGTRVMVRAVAVQADGSIVVGGNAGNVGSPGQFLLLRYSPGGTLDPTFGAGGIVMTSFGSEFGAEVQALGIQADGMIVAAGSNVPSLGGGAKGEFALARYVADGSLDPTFGTGGLVSTSFGFFTNPGARAQALAIQPDGKLVVGGYTNLGDGVHFAMARYQTNGALDPLFYGGGVYDSPGKVIGVNHGHWAYAVALQADGRMLLGGGNRDGVFVLARFTTVGGADPSFGPAHTGIATTSLAPGLFTDEVFGLAVQADGKLVAAGLTHNGADYDHGLARYNADGTLDADFGSSGIVKTGIAPPAPGVGSDYAQAAALQPDGKLVVAGYSNVGNYVFSLARYVTAAPAAADLSLTLGAGDAHPPIDSDVTFLVAARNAGPSEATGVVVRIPLPAGLAFVDAPGGAYDPATGLWSAGNIPAGGTASLSLVARVAEASPANVVAEVVAADQPDPDSTPDNGVAGEDDQATVLVTPRRVADLSLALAASSLEPLAGSDVTLTLTLTNAGTADATGVAVRLPVPPAGLRFVSADPPASYDAGTGVWAVGSLPAAGGASLTLVATVVSLVAVDVVAEVAAADTFDPDSTPGNGSPAEDDYAAVRLVPHNGGIVVNHNGSRIDPNDGFCTLREAIIAANTDSVSGPVLGECAAGRGADVIQMRAVPPVHTHMVVDHVSNGGNALPAVQTEITIEGNGAVIERSSAPGTPDLRLFNVALGGSLTLKDATVRGGRSSSCAGVSNSGTLSLLRTTVSDNTAMTSTALAAGGGICNLAGTLTIADSVIRGNRAVNTGLPNSDAMGGGIHIQAGKAMLTNTTVASNAVTANAFARGGGIRVEAGSRLSLADSRVEANTAIEAGAAGAPPARWAIGGGICAAHSAFLTITRTTVMGNSVTGGTPAGQPAVGGGLYLSSVTATITDSTIQANTAASGGGVILVQGATLTMSGGAISANTATGAGVPFASGGGLANGSDASSQPPGTVTLDGVVVNGNEAPKGGGAGIFTSGPATLRGTTVSRNTAWGWGGGVLRYGGEMSISSSAIEGNRAWAGGGLASTDWLGGALTLDDAVVAENQAQSGGGVVVLHGPATFTLRNNTRVERNRASGDDGGGIAVWGGKLIVEDSALSSNVAAHDGGGLWLSGTPGVNATLTRCTINENHADNSSGGGMFGGPGSVLALVDSLVAGNTAKIWAGLANWGGAVTLTGSTVAANTTNFWGGGGIGNSGILTLVGSTVTGNKTGSTGNGGGIEQFPGASLTLDNSTVSGNSATMGGGGVALIFGPSTATLRNGTIVADNVATGPAGGGGLYGEAGARLNLAQTQVRGNRATNGWGGGIYSTGNDAVLTLTGTVVAGNRATSWGGIGNNGTATLTDTIVSDNTATVGGGAGVGNRGRLTLVGSTVRGNKTGPNGFGGGIEQFGGGSVTLDGSTLSANTASLGGGGLGMIFGASSANLRNGSVVADNLASDVYGGGGIDADPGTTIVVADSEIRGNRAPEGLGGGINTQGLVTVNRSTLSANAAPWGAGIAVWNGGSRLNLLRSRVRSNKAVFAAGGVWQSGGAVALLQNSHLESNTSGSGPGGGLFVRRGSGLTTVDRVAISGNSGGYGGGVFADSGVVVRFANSTVSDNRASFGGGLYVSETAPAAQVTLTYSTVAGNDAQSGGGLHAALGATLARSIVAGNQQGGDATGASADCFGAVAGGGTNLVGRATGCPAAGNRTIAPDQVFTLALGRLADNGGPTPTHELLVGSPAIDASLTACAGPPVNRRDQRGVARPRDGNGDGVTACDLGAFER